jgi:hypothetical protein
MSSTFVAVDGESLRDALVKATLADTLHTAFPPGGYFPRLFVSGERWAAVSWTSGDTNGRWRFVAGTVEHRPSPAEEIHPPTYPETKFG